jgi:tetratricopeptide (TPR) repeat protein
MATYLCETNSVTLRRALITPITDICYLLPCSIRWASRLARLRSVPPTRLRDRHGEAVVLRNLGSALMRVERIEEATSTLQKAIQIYRELDDRHVEGTALANLGGALVEAKRFDEAIVTLQEAFQIHRESSTRYNQAVALANLGGALFKVDRLNEAIAATEEAEKNSLGRSAKGTLRT